VTGVADPGTKVVVFATDVGRPRRYPEDHDWHTASDLRSRKAMSIDLVDWPAGHGDDSPAGRELHSGLSGLGGRPALHPAWREGTEPRARLVASASRRAWPAFGLSAPAIREGGRLAA
jgi:hypothetical protein